MTDSELDRKTHFWAGSWGRALWSHRDTQAGDGRSWEVRVRKGAQAVLGLGEEGLQLEGNQETTGSRQNRRTDRRQQAFRGRAGGQGFQARGLITNKALGHGGHTGDSQSLVQPPQTEAPGGARSSGSCSLLCPDYVLSNYWWSGHGRPLCHWRHGSIKEEEGKRWLWLQQMLGSISTLIESSPSPSPAPELNDTRALWVSDSLFTRHNKSKTVKQGQKVWALVDPFLV